MLSSDAYVSNGERYIKIALIGKVLPEDSLNMALSSRLSYYGLGGTRLMIVQGDAVAAPDATAAASDIFKITQATISSQQQQIDSLRMLVREAGSARSAGRLISPELKVLFPQVEDIAIAE